MFRTGETSYDPHRLVSSSIPPHRHRAGGRFVVGHAWPNAIHRPDGSDPVPEGFDWEFWLGGAPARPFKVGIYHPGQWRGWYDFGGGSLADFCCHAFQLAYRALDLDAPSRIEATGDGLGHETFPKACTITYEFPAKGSRGPVRLFFCLLASVPGGLTRFCPCGRAFTASW